MASRGAGPAVMFPGLRGMGGSSAHFSRRDDGGLAFQLHRIRISPDETDGVAGVAQGAFAGVGLAHKERAAVGGAGAINGRNDEVVSGFLVARGAGLRELKELDTL